MMNTQPADRGAAQNLDGEFDEIIHAPVRLRACAMLEMYQEMEFSGMLEILNIRKSALSKHIATLAEADYVQQRRAVRDGRQRLWLSLTPTGHAAYRNHIAALRNIVEAD